MPRADRRVAAAAPWVLGAVTAAVGGYLLLSPEAAADVTTAEVVRGALVEHVELRGEIRPVRSTVLSAPMQSGELQIVQLVPSGTTVDAGDVIARFDDTRVRQTLQERESEVEQAEAEIERSRAEGRIRDEEQRTALLTARYDVERARLDLASPERLVARLDLERARLDLADAEQRLDEEESRARAGRAATEAEVQSLERARDKVADDLVRARRSLAALVIRAPAAGTVHLMVNGRAGGPFGGREEFREGDRAWPGAQIAELPDLSEIRLTAKVDEEDRGRLRTGQTATVRVDALPGRELHATVDDVSVLARVDFTSGWPAVRRFDVRLRLDAGGEELRSGMSATARLEVARLDDVLKMPARAVFAAAGRPVAYRLAGSRFEPAPIEIARRTAEEVAVSAGVAAGDRVATVEPPAAMIAEP